MGATLDTETLAMVNSGRNVFLRICELKDMIKPEDPDLADRISRELTSYIINPQNGFSCLEDFYQSLGENAKRFNLTSEGYANILVLNVSRRYGYQIKENHLVNPL
jgi:hypothetical protein